MSKHKQVHSKSSAEGHSASSWKSKGQKSRKSVLQEQLVEKEVDLAIEFFKSLPAFSFLFVASDGLCGIGPNASSAVELAIWSFNFGGGYSGPIPESRFKSERVDASKRRAEIVTLVEERLRHLRELGASFAMLWQLPDEFDPHLELSDDYREDDAWKDLARLVPDEVSSQISI